MLSTAALTLLSREIDARLRVCFLFFSKTWKKRLAKLPGWTKSFTLVEGNGGLPLVHLA